jgi:MFS family permease
LTGPRRVRTPGIEAPRGETLVTTIRQCWAIPSFRFLALGVGVFNIFGYAGAIWMPAFFMRSHGMTVVEAGTWLSMGAAVGGIAGSMAAGVIVDKLRVRDERWQLRVPALGYFISFPLFLVMFTLAGGAALTVGGVRIPLVAMLSMATGFLGSLWAGPSFGAAARLVAPAQRAQATALLVVVINIIGSTLGPLTAGVVSDLLTARFAIEALRLSLLSMSVLTLVGGMLFWRASVHYPHDLQRGRTP